MMEFPQALGLDSVSSINGVLNAAIITRNGEYVKGTIPATARKDTFSAMSAIMLGASERLAIEINDGLENISIVLDDHVLIIIGLDSQYLMSIISTHGADMNRIIDSARSWKD